MNTLKAHPTDKVGTEARREALSILARLIAPVIPHLAEECWARLGETGMIIDAAWPVVDDKLAADDELVLPVQINGKRRAEVRVAPDLSDDEVQAIAMADYQVLKHLEGLNIKKFIVVKNRIINIVVA